MLAPCILANYLFFSDVLFYKYLKFDIHGLNLVILID